MIKRRFPSVPIAPILISVQAMELAWVALDHLGVERTATESTVSSVADIHLAYMPYSHSVGTALVAALAAWLVIENGFRRASLGRAVGIVLWPGLESPKLGLTSQARTRRPPTGARLRVHNPDLSATAE